MEERNIEGYPSRGANCTVVMHMKKAHRPTLSINPPPHSVLWGTLDTCLSIWVGISEPCQCFLPSSQKTNQEDSRMIDCYATRIWELSWYFFFLLPRETSTFIRPIARGLHEIIITFMVSPPDNSQNRFPPGPPDRSWQWSPEFLWIHSKSPDVLSQ